MITSFLQKIFARRHVIYIYEGYGTRRHTCFEKRTGIRAIYIVIASFISLFCLKYLQPMIGMLLIPLLAILGMVFALALGDICVAFIFGRGHHTTIKVVRKNDGTIRTKRVS